MIFLLLIFLLAACTGGDPALTAAPTVPVTLPPDETATVAVTVPPDEATLTLTPSATETPSPTSTWTLTPSPTATATATPSPAVTSTLDATPTREVPATAQGNLVGNSLFLSGTAEPDGWTIYRFNNSKLSFWMLDGYQGVTFDSRNVTASAGLNQTLTLPAGEYEVSATYYVFIESCYYGPRFFIDFNFQEAISFIVPIRMLGPEIVTGSLTLDTPQTATLRVRLSPASTSSLCRGFLTLYEVIVRRVGEVGT